MRELKKIPVGVMPHGARISPDGTRLYTVGMMSGELFEINTLTLEVARVLNLDTNEPLHAHQDKMMANHKNHHAGHAMGAMEDGTTHQHSAVKPTWVMPHPDGKRVYVAGNGSNEILEIDLASWQITHRMPCGQGPYNLDVTPDGTQLIVSYKGEGSTGIWDLKNYKELAHIPNTRKVTHGVALSPDSKYAFISVEGIGGEPGTMDVIDLRTLQRVATAELGKQAGGIAFWKME
jgi:DNA-binding beta-propeller fold protein YncE